MGGARALIASLGASFSLVAGAAVSLLLFSFVFALPGLTGGSDAPASTPLEIRSESAAPQTAREAADRAEPRAVVISAPERKRAAARPAGSVAVAQREAADAKPDFNPSLRELSPPAPPAAAPAPAPAAQPAIGDSVRDVGDVVTATVQGAGAATAPLLGPAVSQAIQDVLDLLTSVLQGATGAVGGAVDKTLPR